MKAPTTRRFSSALIFGFTFLASLVAFSLLLTTPPTLQASEVPYTVPDFALTTQEADINLQTPSLGANGIANLAPCDKKTTKKDANEAQANKMDSTMIQAMAGFASYDSSLKTLGIANSYVGAQASGTYAALLDNATGQSLIGVVSDPNHATNAVANLQTLPAGGAVLKFLMTSSASAHTGQTIGGHTGR